MNLRVTTAFDEEYKKLTKGNQKLARKIVKQIDILRKNPSHPSLRLHKLHNSNYWSVSVNESIRMLILIEDAFIIVYHIGKHEDVY